VTQGADRKQDVARRIVGPVSRRLWRIHVEGLERLPRHGPAILAPNHISFLDSAFLMLIVPRRISFVGKAEYMDSWKTKFVFPALGMIPIDRRGGEHASTALDAAQRVLQRGELFGIFPEGTRSRNGKLHKGHTGAARLALRVGCPIYPVGIVGTSDIQPADAKLPKLFRSCTFKFGRPLQVDRYKGREDDRMVLRSITDELMFEIRELTGQEYVNTYATKQAEGLSTEVAQIKRVEPAVVASERDLAEVG